MNIKAHTIQAAVISAVASSYITNAETLVLFLSIIFIDLDHYFDYVCVTRRFGLRDMFRFHNYVWHHREKLYGISLFHTVEVFILLYFLGAYISGYFHIVLLGFLLHMALDLISLFHNRMLFKRAFFITEYIIKRRLTDECYPVPDDSYWR